MSNGQFQPGNSGRPKGSKNKSTRKADEAFEKVFDALQTSDTTSLKAWAKENLGDFYKLFAKKLTTTSENENYNLSESVTQAQARQMAEAFIESTRNRVGTGEPDRLHDSVSTGLPGSEVAPQDCSSVGEGGEGRVQAADDLRAPEAREIDADIGALPSLVLGEKPE